MGMCDSGQFGHQAINGAVDALGCFEGAVGDGLSCVVDFGIANVWEFLEFVQVASDITDFDGV